MICRPRIRVEFSFLAMNAMIFLLFSCDEIKCFYSVCAVHELGHLLAICAMRVRINSVTFSAFGIVIEISKQSGEAIWRTLTILLSGPIVNIAIFAVLFFTGHCGTAAFLNLAAGINNLLPYPQLDGGAAIALLTEGTVFQRSAETILFALRCGLSAILLAACFLVGTEILPFFIVSVMLLITASDSPKFRANKKRDA